MWVTHESFLSLERKQKPRILYLAHLTSDQAIWRVNAMIDYKDARHKTLDRYSKSAKELTKIQRAPENNQRWVRIPRIFFVDEWNCLMIRRLSGNETVRLCVQYNTRSRHSWAIVNEWPHLRWVHCWRGDSFDLYFPPRGPNWILMLRHLLIVQKSKV